MNYELTRFSKQETGMLFFYFSSLDQDTHMYWRTIDPKHPLYDHEVNKKYGDTLRQIYVEMDRALGRVLDQNDMNDPNFTIMAMSDHGFAPFRRQVNVNTWLFKNDYMALTNSADIENKGYFENVNWSDTGAYGVGINSIYLNLKGREEQGVVHEGQAKIMREEIRQNLLRLVDPKTGKKAVTSVWIVPDEERRINPQAPDLVIGWNYGYRTSWDSILGGFSKNIFSDNLDKWSGDHCIDPNLVPAVLFANRKITNRNPSLCDITPTILGEFQLTPNQNVEGNSLFQI
jgi:predicted AlkP superfamily phosphohydrolase/phosphomutase